MASRRSGIGSWRRIAGRRFQNIDTGETISRRQFDKRYGILARENFPSYEAKAKATPVEIKKTRPARGRPSIRPNPRNLRPTGGSTARSVVMRIRLKLDDEEWVVKLPRYRFEYEAIRKDLVANKAIFAIGVAVSGVGNPTLDTMTVLTAMARVEIEDFEHFSEELIDRLARNSYTFTMLTSIIFRVRFFDRFTKPHLRKSTLKKRRR